MGIEYILSEVKRRGFYTESAVSLINGALRGLRSIDEIRDASQKIGLVVASERWLNPTKISPKEDYLLTFRLK